MMITTWFAHGINTPRQSNIIDITLSGNVYSPTGEMQLIEQQSPDGHSDTEPEKISICFITLIFFG